MILRLNLVNLELKNLYIFGGFILNPRSGSFPI